MPSDPNEAISVWRGLVDGRWALVDHWESNGRRFVLARRNAPGSRDPKALTTAEGAVVAFLARGHAEKYVAYLLGVSPSTVASQFASARRKLGVRSRQELVALFSGRYAEAVSTVDVGRAASQDRWTDGGGAVRDAMPTRRAMSPARDPTPSLV